MPDLLKYKILKSQVMYTDADGHENLYQYFNLSRNYKSEQNRLILFYLVDFYTYFILFKVYSCEIQVVPNEIIFVEEKADYPWTQMLRWVMRILPPG